MTRIRVPGNSDALVRLHAIRRTVHVMRCPRCGGSDSGLSTTMTSNEDPAARWQTTCAGCGYRWVHPLRMGWTAPAMT